MKRSILLVVIGILLIRSDLFASNGDLIVNGSLGVGTTPTAKLHVKGKTYLGNAVIGPLNTYSVSIGDTSTNYLPVAGNWNYSLLLNAQDTSSIGFHDAAHSVGSIRYAARLFTIGGDDGWGTAEVSFPGGNVQVSRSDTLSTRLELYQNSVAGFQGQWIIASRDTPNLGFYNNGYLADVMTLLPTGRVGIGTMSPSYQLQLSTDSAAKPSTNTWSVASDARLKTDIQPYTKGLSEVLRINPVSYRYNGKGGIGYKNVWSKDPVTGEDVEIQVVDTELLSKNNVGVIA